MCFILEKPDNIFRLRVICNAFEFSEVSATQVEVHLAGLKEVVKADTGEFLVYKPEIWNVLGPQGVADYMEQLRG